MTSGGPTQASGLREQSHKSSCGDGRRRNRSANAEAFGHEALPGRGRARTVGGAGGTVTWYSPHTPPPRLGRGY